VETKEVALVETKAIAAASTPVGGPDADTAIRDRCNETWLTAVADRRARTRPLPIAGDGGVRRDGPFPRVRSEQHGVALRRRRAEPKESASRVPPR
jgi:hypothetical protein